MDALLQISFSKANFSTNRTNWRLQHSKIFIFHKLFSILIPSKHLNGQLGPRVNDVTFFWGQLGSVSQFVCNIFILPILNCTNIWSTISNPNWALEARSKTLRKPLNVPAQTESWPEDPILGLADSRPALAKLLTNSYPNHQSSISNQWILFLWNTALLVRHNQMQML